MSIQEIKDTINGTEYRFGKSHDYHTSAHVPQEDYDTIVGNGFYIYSENIKREKWKVMDETFHKIAEHVSLEEALKLCDREYNNEQEM